MNTDELNTLTDTMENATEHERMTEIKKHFPQFKIRDTFIGTECKKNNFRGTYGDRNQYKVTIYNGAHKFSTTFTDSIYNTQNGKKSSHFDMLYCIVSDMQCVQYNDTFEDFASEFGYDEDSRSAEKIYKACLKTKDNLERLFGNDGCEILNAVTYGY